MKKRKHEIRKGFNQTRMETNIKQGIKTKTKQLSNLRIKEA